MENENKWTPEMKAFKRKLENAVRESGGYGQRKIRVGSEGKLEKIVVQFSRVVDAVAGTDYTMVYLKNGEKLEFGSAARFNRGEYLFYDRGYSKSEFKLYSSDLEYQHKVKSSYLGNYTQPNPRFVNGGHD